jgi:hypothetical protein
MGIIIGGNTLSGINFNSLGETPPTPNIITNNLVIYLDAGNASSYINSSNYYDCGYGCQYYSSNPGCTSCNSQWKDMSGFGNDASMSSSSMITYSSFGGGMNFNGSNLGTITYSSLSMDFSAAQTICMWIRPGSGSTGARRNLYDQAYAGSGTLTHEPGTEINYYFGTGGGNNSPYVGIGSGFGVSTDELAFITVTRSQSQNICRWYKNGIKYTDTNAGGYASVTNSTNNIRIGLGYTGAYYLGDIYVVMVYNKFFTDAEVLQNFNNGRQRFGV